MKRFLEAFVVVALLLTGLVSLKSEVIYFMEQQVVQEEVNE